MKLRIKGASLRLRLQQSEIQQLSEHGLVVEELILGPGPVDRFRYAVETTHGDSLGIRYAPREIVVLFPLVYIEELVKTDRVGHEAEVAVAHGQFVHVVVEKDFRCLVIRPGEDESNMYPHPNEGAVC